jgi:hypothetical protein
MHGDGPGHADVVLLGDDPDYGRATSFAVFASVVDKPDFASVLIIAPPTHSAADGLVDRATAIVHAHGVVAVSRPVLHQRMETLDSSAVVDVCRKARDRVLVYVLGAGQFRSTSISAQKHAKPTEDIWLPHLLALAEDLSNALRGTESYAVLDSGHFPVVQAKSRALLAEASVQVISMGLPEDAKRIATAILNSRSDDTASMGEALAAIASAEHLDPKMHALLQAAALHGAERDLGAWEVLSPFWEELLTARDARIVVQVARIAVDGGQFASAKAALRTLNVASLPAELLEPALVSAARCDRELESEILDRIIALRPDSDFAAMHLINACIRDQDWEGLRQHAANENLSIDADERATLSELAEALQRSDSDFREGARHFVDTWPSRADWARTLFAREALRRRNYSEAVAQCVAVSVESDEGARSASLAIDTVEAVLLHRTEHGHFIIPDEVLAQVVAFAAAHAARAPRDVKLRARLTELLSPGVIGARGEGLLMFLIEQLASEPAREEPLVVADTTLDEAEVLLDSIVEMLKNASPGNVIVLGVGRLPDVIDRERAKRLLHVLPEMLDHALAELETPDDVSYARLILHAALLTCERAGAPRLGLMLLRHFAVHLASSGWSQEARDTVEHGLNLVSDDRSNLRVAWATFGDVYHRIGNLHEALVGMLLAISFSQASLRTEESWQELFLLVRLLRDLGLYESAEAMLARSETLLTMTDTKKARLESIQLSIDLRRHDAQQRAVPDEGLIDRLAANLERLLELGDDVIPPLALLLQLVARAAAAGVATPPRVALLIERALSKVGPTMRERLLAFGATEPDLKTVRALVSRAAALRASEDIGYDIQAAALVAQRALRRAEQFDAWSVVELIDVLTDKTLVTPSAHADPSAMRRGAAYLLERGHAIQVLGQDETGSLVRVTVRPDGSVHLVRETELVFDRQAFSDWKKIYPFEYCRMDDPTSMRGDLVRRSVDRLGVSALGPERTVTVADVRLSGFPMNLLRVDNDFAGELVAVSSVPSLAWLANVTETPRALTGRRIAWISDAVPVGNVSPALAPLADRLDPVLSAHDVSFSRSRQLPTELRGADLAIVTAHGGLSPDDRFFQVLADDAEERWSADSLADAVADAGVVVLFVCSAGRFDEHPRARASLGLPKLLLAAGVRTVVASPWPLDTMVPPRWLPAFLADLDGGACVSDAVFAANHAVAQAFSGNPPHAFAMHVIGDPTQTLSRPQK